MTAAGLVELSLGGRGPSRAFVFDPHRLALCAWAEVVGSRPALLVTLDRHFDLVPPATPPKHGLRGEALELHVRTHLDARNVDHVLAGMEAGVVSDVIAVARAKPMGAFEGTAWEDSRGGHHEMVRAATIDALSHDFGRAAASPEAQRAHRLLGAAEQVLLDVDLDCFTTPSDADPTAIIPWPRALMAQHLRPRASEAFWAAVLGKCAVLTIAREPLHCGGLVAMGRLFEDFAAVMFEGLLETDLP